MLPASLSPSAAHGTASSNRKVSIVIPCFNQGTTLSETLHSIEQVRNTSLAEVIIVNDGSTEPQTCRLLQQLAASSYLILHQSNRGLGAARNAGIRVAKGEYILPLDSDNRIRECYLAAGVELLEKEPTVGVLYGNAEYFGEKGGVWKVPEFNLLDLVQMNFIDACALFRKSVWASVGGYDEQMPWMGWEDWDFWLRAAAHGCKFAHLDEIAFDYRVQSGSMLEGTKAHADELLSYIFGKHQNQAHKLIRELSDKAARTRQIEQSSDYKLGRSILYPLRRLKRCLLWRRRTVRAKGGPN